MANDLKKQEPSCFNNWAVTKKKKETKKGSDLQRPYLMNSIEKSLNIMRGAGWFTVYILILETQSRFYFTDFDPHAPFSHPLACGI